MVILRISFLKIFKNFFEKNKKNKNNFKIFYNENYFLFINL